MNSVYIRGRLTRPADVRQTPSGKTVADFSIAMNERRKNASGEWEDGPTSFIDCAAWGYQAERVGDLDKGALMVVAGRLKQETWEKGGQKRSKIRVIADSVDAVALMRRAEPSTLTDTDDDLSF